MCPNPGKASEVEKMEKLKLRLQSQRIRFMPEITSNFYRFLKYSFTSPLRLLRSYLKSNLKEMCKNDFKIN